MKPQINNNNGYILLSIALSIVILPLMILITTQIYSATLKTASLQRSTSTKSAMTTIKNWLISTALDADGDGKPELLVEGGGNTLPLSIPVRQNDEWGTPYIYLTWDLGAANTNIKYSKNRDTPPGSGAPILIGRIISAGKDGIPQTDSTSTVAGGDDIMIDIFSADVLNNTNNSGWTEDVANNKIIQTTTGRWVGINNSTPLAMLDVNGDVLVSGRFSATNVVSGINSTKTNTFTDPNLALPSGFYSGNVGINTPTAPTVEGWYLTVTRHTDEGSNYQKQIITTTSTGVSWTRIINNGVPLTWTRDLSSSVFYKCPVDYSLTTGGTWASYGCNGQVSTDNHCENLVYTSQWGVLTNTVACTRL